MEKNEWEDGIGIMETEDGYQYIGEWTDGIKDGKGSYTWPNGENYIGEWKRGEEHGQGTMTYRAGETYSGNWINGKYQNNNINNLPNRDMETRALDKSGSNHWWSWNSSTFFNAFKSYNSELPNIHIKHDCSLKSAMSSTCIKARKTRSSAWQ